MSWQLGTPNTGTALAALDANSVRILWQKTVDVYEQAEDFWMQFEGSSKTSPIWVINDTSVGKGLKFRITNRAGYYGPGKQGDNLFNNSADFETDVINSNEIDADFVRNATSITQRTDEYMGMQGELANGQAEELGKWMGREKSAMVFATIGYLGNTDNYLISNKKSSVDQLKSADAFLYNDILLMGQALKPKGATPCEVGTVKGQPVRKYCVVGTTPGLFGLKQDPNYQLILQNAAPREKWDENPLFSGGYAELDGHSIREYNPVDADGYSVVGSVFNPKAYLGTAITAGTGTFAIAGGGSAAAAALTTYQYFRFFPNYQFPFIGGQVNFTAPSTARYLLVVNSANDPYGPGVGMYQYTTGNNGNTITITQRLAAVQNGPVALSTVGNVTWNTGVWSTANGGPGHNENHSIGATIILCNAYGTPIGGTVMFGAGFLLRGYGSMRNQRSQWLVDGGFETRKYITSVFGQQLRKNTSGKYPGFVFMTHAISYPELGLPTVT